jgi:hypothetical protein
VQCHFCFQFASKVPRRAIKYHARLAICTLLAGLQISIGVLNYAREQGQRRRWQPVRGVPAIPQRCAGMQQPSVGRSERAPAHPLHSRWGKKLDVELPAKFMGPCKQTECVFLSLSLSLCCVGERGASLLMSQRLALLTEHQLRRRDMKNNKWCVCICLAYLCACMCPF